MITLSKVITYHGNSFNLNVTLNANTSEDEQAKFKPHQLIVNDLGHTTYRQVYYFNCENMLETIALAEKDAKTWWDNRGQKTKEELKLMDVGFK